MNKKLLKSSSNVAIMTALSRVVGLVREIVFANTFGASAGLDAFLVAFRVPNFLRRLFAEGSFSQAFVPVLSEYRQTRSVEEARTFINDMAGTLGAVLLIVTTIAIVLSPIVVIIFAPGFLHDPHRLHMTTAMLRITFPYLFFISLTAFAGSILNSYDSFSVPAFTPALLNVALILAAVFLAPHFHNPVMALAWGVFLGGALQLGFQLPFLYKRRLLPKPKINLKDPGVRKVIKLMLPAIIGVSVAQIGVLLDTLYASFLREGSITWLYFSDRLTNFPIGVFGIAIATVVLPHLSRKHAANSEHEFSASLDWALRCILIIGIPAAVGLLILAGPLLSTILQHGRFDAFDVNMAARSTMAFALGVPAFMMIKVLVTGFYSQQDIKTPVRIAVISVITNALINLILIFPLKHAGLALATTLASSLNASLLFLTLKKRGIFQPRPGWKKYFLQLGFANAAMALFIFLASAKLSTWIDWSWSTRIFHLIPILGGAGIIYLACLLISGLRPRDFLLTRTN